MKTILITGASGGIGAATARSFLNAGWQVGLAARRRAALEEVAQGHPNAHVLPCDVTDAAQVEAAFADFDVPHLDAVFCNAGIFSPTVTPDELSVDDWTQAVQVNLTGMFLSARAAFARMRGQTPQGGRIIMNGSVSAHSPRPGAIAYTATKHAVTGLTKSLSLDGRAFNIACGQIDIGNAETDLLRDIADRARAAGDPPPPMFDVDLVGQAVLQMASLPLNANVQFQTLMATQMPFIGRG